jgi:membrane protease YdiL (CAAX protease family)
MEDIMASSKTSWLGKHSLLAYFILAYAITWAFEIPLAAAGQGWIASGIPFGIHYLGGFGPMLAALIVTATIHGRRGVRDLFSGLLKWRVGAGWIVFSFLSPFAMFAFAAVAMRATSGIWPNLSLLGEVDYLPYLGIPGAVILWLLTWGMGEEVGWRGFALPRLQRDRSALSATIILGVIHALWHLPAFFYKDAYKAMGLAAGLPMLVISVVAAAILFTWIYNSTRGSLLMVTVFHALFDWLSVSKAGSTTAPAIMSGVVWVLAVLVVVIYKPANLSRVGKQVA